jgi:hypothetical protein
MDTPKKYKLKTPDGLAVTAEELALRYKGMFDTPTEKPIKVGYTKDGTAMGFYANGRWWVYASGTIFGDWVQVYPEGMPLVNGERPYPDDQFIEV